MNIEKDWSNWDFFVVISVLYSLYVEHDRESSRVATKFQACSNSGDGRATIAVTIALQKSCCKNRKCKRAFESAWLKLGATCRNRNWVAMHTNIEHCHNSIT